MTLIKSISGIRGTIGGSVGDNLTPIDLVRFTTAFAKFIAGRTQGKPRVVVGRDARISGAMCSSIVTATLAGCGIDVIDIDLAATPTVELAVTEFKADGGIILTASHNARQWNALKLLDSAGEFLTAAEGAQVLSLAESTDLSYASIDELGSIERVDSFNDRHIEMVLALPAVNCDAIRARRYKVVVDAVNSVGGIVIPQLLRALGCQVIELNCTPDGNFAHNPEPLAEHLTEISALVVASGADLGVVVDPDVDRLALVSQTGEMFGEEYTLVAVADYILGRAGGGNTVSNLSSSRALDDVTVAHGGTYQAAAVGEVNVVAKMKQTGAIIGGEGNGGVIYPESHYGRDALVGVALFLTHLADKNVTMSELRASYPQYVMSKNRVELTASTDVDAILRKVAGKFADQRITTIDGVKIDMADGWVHLRKSNTEPIIRIYSEAHSAAKAEELAEMICRTLR